MSPYLEKEVVLVTETVVDSFDNFDFDVDSFECARVNAVIAVGENTMEALFESAGEAV